MKYYDEVISKDSKMKNKKNIIEETDEYEFYWSLNKKYTCLVYLRNKNDTEKELIIPGKIKGIEVDYLNTSHIEYPNVKKLILEEGIKYIDAFSFEGCYNIETIKFPKTLRDISPNAFNETEWQRIELSKNKPIIINDIYYKIPVNCADSEIPTSVTKICNSAFSKCSGIIDVTIPENIKEIGKFAFAYCSSLRNIVFENDLDILPDGILSDCNKLKNVVLPKDLKGIGSCAFADDTKIEEIHLPDSIEVIGAKSFIGCHELTKINTPNELGKIGDAAFEQCTSLTETMKNDKLYFMGKRCYGSCHSLTNGYLANDEHVQNQSEIFSGCYSLKNVEFKPQYTKIPNSTFDGCFGLEHIELPSTLKTIGRNAFSACSKLVDVTVPSGCKISDTTFGNIAKKTIKYDRPLSEFQKFFQNKDIINSIISLADYKTFYDLFVDDVENIDDKNIENVLSACNVATQKYIIDNLPNEINATSNLNKKLALLGFQSKKEAKAKQCEKDKFIKDFNDIEK